MTAKKLMSAGVLAGGVWIATSILLYAQAPQRVAAGVPPGPIPYPSVGVKGPKLLTWAEVWNPKTPHDGKTVLVGYTVGLDGHTHNIHIIKGQGAIFDRNAMYAVACMKYQPATVNGARVPVSMTQKIEFVQVDGPDNTRDYPMFGAATGRDMSVQP